MLSVYKLCPLLWFNLTCPPGGCPEAPKRLLYLHRYNYVVRGGMWGGNFLCLVWSPPREHYRGRTASPPQEVSVLLTLDHKNSGFLTAASSLVQTNCSCQYNLLHILKSSKSDFFPHTNLYFLICSGQNRRSISYHRAVSGETDWLCKAELTKALCAYQRSPF